MAFAPPPNAANPKAYAHAPSSCVVGNEPGGSGELFGDTARGVLKFDANFEGGNLGTATALTENEYEITIRPDTNAKRYRVWFHFAVTNWRPHQKVLFHVTNFSKSKSLYKEGMSPIFRNAVTAGSDGDDTTGGKAHHTDTQNAGGGSTPQPWERVHPKSVFYYRAKDGLSGGDRLKRLETDRDRTGDDAAHDENGELTKKPKKPHVLSFSHVFPGDTSDVDKNVKQITFAYSYPFSVSATQRILDELEKKNLPHFHRRVLTHSLQGRRCDVVVVDGGDDPESPNGTPLSPRRVVFVTARVHPGETPSSHTVFGLLRFVVSDHADAKLLRKKVTFVFVPLLNPDGCFHGNYRSDSSGKDLNRHWVAPSEQNEPTLWHTKQLIKWYARDPNHALDFFIDAHAHTNSKSSFLYVNPPSFGGEDSSDEESGSDGDETEADNCGSNPSSSVTEASKKAQTADESGQQVFLREKRTRAFRYERAAALPRLMELNCGSSLGFSLGACRFCANPEKKGAGRRAVGKMLRQLEIEDLRREDNLDAENFMDGTNASDVVRGDTAVNGASTPPPLHQPPITLGLARGPGAMMCYTLEMSFYGVDLKSRKGWAPTNSNDEVYANFGVGLAYSFLDYYGLRRDLAAEAVTNTVVSAAATGEMSHLDRMFESALERNGSFEFREKEVVNFVVDGKDGRLRDKEWSCQMPWIRGCVELIKKTGKTSGRPSPSARMTGRPKGKTAEKKNRSEVVDATFALADVSRAIAALDTGVDGSSDGTGSALELVTSQMVSPGTSPKTERRTPCRKERVATVSTLNMDTSVTVTDAVLQKKGSLGGGQFKGSGRSFSGGAGGGVKPVKKTPPGVTKTGLAAFRVPGLGGFGGDGFGVSASVGATSNGNGNDAQGLATEFAELETSGKSSSPGKKRGRR